MGQSCLLLLCGTWYASLHRSQFYITFKPAAHLDKKHTVFGKLVGGEDVLDTLEKLPRKDGTERPAKSVKITEVVMYAPMSLKQMIISKKATQLSGSFRRLQS